MDTWINANEQSRTIIIDGPNNVQNRVLAQLIEERIGQGCLIIAADRLNPNAWTRLLVLLDAAHCRERLPVLSAKGNFTIALINADEPFPCEYIACPGVKGLFCSDTGEDDFIKGIKAILQGEYWLPRRLLCAHLERTRSVSAGAPNAAATPLTPKETQILRLVTKGHGTKQIARELNVSPHTVKAHTANAFRKIQVSNRVQAAHWVWRHIGGMAPGAFFPAAAEAGFG